MRSVYRVLYYRTFIPIYPFFSRSYIKRRTTKELKKRINDVRLFSLQPAYLLVFEGWFLFRWNLLSRKFNTNPRRLGYTDKTHTNTYKQMHTLLLNPSGMLKVGTWIESYVFGRWRRRMEWRVKKIFL